ncbi:peroxisome assembly protein (Peroxin-2) [Elasticomyces elasticus]|nr:peroxisome assembly protein (Peroxin-2) [Elasticomyces elasticus]
MTDFAAAQQRIIARRVARNAQAASITAIQQSERNASLIRLPPSLRVLANQTLNFWNTVRSPYGTRPAFRVGQVDAELLDEELINLLKSQAGDGLKLFGAHLKDDWGPEIGLILRSILWKLAIWDHGASYGASLQGLKYVDARQQGNTASGNRPPSTSQRVIYGLMTVGGRYAWTKWEDHLSVLDNSYDIEPSPLIHRLSRFTTLASSTHEVAAFASFLVFLYNGKHRTLADRLLRLRLVPSSNQTSREVSFEYLNRQLVWHAFTEFLLFLLPLVGIMRWRRWIARAWKRTKTAVTKLRTGESTAAQDTEDAPTGELAFLPERTCAICYQDQNPTSGRSEQDVVSAGANQGIIGNASTDITNPYETMPCGCVYCFVCLAQRIEGEEGEGWVCLRCGEVVKECKPWNGDVFEDTAKDSIVGSEEGERPRSAKGVAWADEVVEQGTGGDGVGGDGCGEGDLDEDSRVTTRMVNGELVTFVRRAGHEGGMTFIDPRSDEQKELEARMAQMPPQGFGQLGPMPVRDAEDEGFDEPGYTERVMYGEVIRRAWTPEDEA